MIETRLLRQFIAVAEELHFHRAAERLNMAQPPLSQAIRRLEAEIGVRLFERSNRSVALTAAGVSFLESARHVLQALDASVEQARHVAAGVTGQLTAMFVATAQFDLLPDIVRTFRSRWPCIELTLREGTTAQQIEALRAGAADIGLLRWPGAAVPDLTFERIAQEAVLIALPADHPEAARPQVPLAALAQDSFIATPRAEGAGFYDHMIGLCRSAGFSPRIVQEARQIETIVGLVAGGLGVALVPASIARAQRHGVVLRPLLPGAGGDLAFLDLLACWNPSKASPARDNFLDVARQAASSICSRYQS